MARVCGACGKAFSSEFFLGKHMDRRHPGLLQRQRYHEKETEKKEVEKAEALLPTEGGGGAVEEAVTAGSAAGPPEHASEAAAAGGAGTGGDEKDQEKDQEKEREAERAAEVAEGARRLGELVREREHARFRSEVVALRKEIEDLKVRAEGGLSVDGRRLKRVGWGAGQGGFFCA